MEIEITMADGKVEIAPPPPEGKLVRKNGLLYWEPAAGTPETTLEEINEAIRKLREERTRF